MEQGEVYDHVQQHCFLAITQSINPTGSPIIMTTTQDAGVVVKAALSVGRDFYAPNMYNKSQVDYIASSKQATLLSST